MSPCAGGGFLTPARLHQRGQSVAGLSSPLWWRCRVRNTSDTPSHSISVFRPTAACKCDAIRSHCDAILSHCDAIRSPLYVRSSSLQAWQVRSTAPAPPPVSLPLALQFCVSKTQLGPPLLLHQKLQVLCKCMHANLCGCVIVFRVCRVWGLGFRV